MFATNLQSEYQRQDDGTKVPGSEWEPGSGEKMVEIVHGSHHCRKGCQKHQGSNRPPISLLAYKHEDYLSTQNHNAATQEPVMQHASLASYRNRRVTTNGARKGDVMVMDLQDGKLARPQGEDGEESEADDETSQGSEVASTKDHQTIPSTNCNSG